MSGSSLVQYSRVYLVVQIPEFNPSSWIFFALLVKNVASFHTARSWTMLIPFTQRFIHILWTQKWCYFSCNPCLVCWTWRAARMVSGKNINFLWWCNFGPIWTHVRYVANFRKNVATKFWDQFWRSRAIERVLFRMSGSSILTHQRCGEVWKYFILFFSFTSTLQRQNGWFRGSK